ncbi:MAG: NAD(P)/FAD-dependent oxidoreductase [Promethearchaeota archaeon]|nr:MAG: NAD(P)/FAD-dependent oxidoreductase [Candidatus Lokiarchaeota archaeon]
MESDISCDVCIIGGNIAGSYLAYNIASNGLSVVVVEQNRIPGVPMQCAGIVSQRLTNIVDIDPSIIINRVDTAWLISENGKKVSVSIRDNPYILDRVKLDQYFYHKAENIGVKYLLGEKFSKYEIHTKNGIEIVQITTKKRTINAQMIVGCDGPNSLVAKLHGIEHKLIPAMQIRAFFPQPHNSVRMYFKKKWKNLFGWVIPEGNGICRIGLGCKYNLRTSFQGFITDLNITKSEIIEKFGGQILIGYPKKIAFHRAILLGDAAGMVKATTGGGINTLLKASKTAKEVILEAFSRNDFTKRFFITHYQHSSEIRRLKMNILLHYFVRVIMLSLTQEEYEQSMLLLHQPKTRELLLKYGDMDFPIKFIFKMLLRVDLWRYIIKILPSILNKVPQILQEFLDISKY